MLSLAVNISTGNGLFRSRKYLHNSKPDNPGNNQSKIANVYLFQLSCKQLQASSPSATQSYTT